MPSAKHHLKKEKKAKKNLLLNLQIHDILSKHSKQPQSTRESSVSNIIAIDDILDDILRNNNSSSSLNRNNHPLSNINNRKLFVENLRHRYENSPENFRDYLNSNNVQGVLPRSYIVRLRDLVLKKLPRRQQQ